MSRAGPICFRSGRVPPVFNVFKTFATKALNIVRTQLTLIAVTKKDDDRKVVMRPDSQPVVTSLFKNSLLLSSAAEHTDRKSNMRRRISDDIGNASPKNKLKRTIMTRTLMEPEAQISAHERKWHFLGWRLVRYVFDSERTEKDLNEKII